jgi:hypothetical protein
MKDQWEVLAPETVLPAQFFDCRIVVVQPEKRLMLAVLESAVWVLLHRHQGRGRIAEAERWVASTATDWPFAFLNVCQALGLDPDYVRAGLARHARLGRDVGATPPRPRHFVFRRIVAGRQRITGRRRA